MTKKLKLTGRKSPTIVDTSTKAAPVAPAEVAKALGAEPAAPRHTHGELRALVDHAIETIKPKPPISVEYCQRLRDHLSQKVVGASVEVYHHHHTLIVRVRAGVEVMVSVPLT